jgi:hypothetical protein
MKRVLETPHWTIDVDETARVATLARTPAVYADLSSIGEAMRPIEAALDALRKTRYSALIDLRNGPLRSDEAFEKAFTPYRLALPLGWKRVAVVVASAIGKLQVSRHHSNDKSGLVIFTDPDAAWSHVAG